MSYVYDLLLT